MLLQLKRMFLIYYLNLKLIPDPATEPFWEQKKLVTLLLLTLSTLVCKMRKTKLCKELSIQKSRTKDAKSDIRLIAIVIMAFIFTNFTKFLKDTLFG